MTDILSKDITRVAVEARECVGPSESLFEGTHFEEPPHKSLPCQTPMASAD